MTVAFSSISDLAYMEPMGNFVLITINDIGTYEEHQEGWKAHHHLTMAVLHPIGPNGSFELIDKQAKEIAKYIKLWVKDEDNIIVRCTYGEQRSVCVARAIAYSKGQTLHRIVRGEFTDFDNFGETIFQGRTTRAILDKLNQM